MKSYRIRSWGKWAAGAAALVWIGAAAAQSQTHRLGELPVPGLATRTLDAARFRALHRAMAPQGEGERWAEIPWEADLVAARQRAAREKKPLLIWLMDGHPLGCT